MYGSIRAVFQGPLPGEERGRVRDEIALSPFPVVASAGRKEREGGEKYYPSSGKPGKLPRLLQVGQGECARLPVANGVFNFMGRSFFRWGCVCTLADGNRGV